MFKDDVWEGFKELTGVTGVSKPSAGIRREAWNVVMAERDVLAGGDSIAVSLEAGFRIFEWLT